MDLEKQTPKSASDPTYIRSIKSDKAKTVGKI